MTETTTRAKPAVTRYMISTRTPISAVLVIIALFISSICNADVRDQAKRIHDRLTGVPPSAETLDDMTELIASGDPLAAANLAVEHPDFYDVTLKVLVAPWTNEEQSKFVSLNDYSATIIGTIRDNYDFREIFYADRTYIGKGSLGLPAYATNNNAHYEQLDALKISLKDNLQEVTQSSVTGLPPDATAGVITSRAAAKAYFIGGTNRAMFRFMVLNHLCNDLEQYKDNTLPADRIRQDISRSPGGDSRLYLNNCLGCHTGMDPMTQAFAYYDYAYDSNNDPDGLQGALVYNDVSSGGSRVQVKYHINATTFPLGYITPDDRWDNYWRQGKNKVIGWSSTLPGAGNGAKSLGMELSHTEAFASCQVKHAFETVCLRAPSNSADRNLVKEIADELTTSSFNLKTAFTKSAVYCMGE